MEGNRSGFKDNLMTKIITEGDWRQEHVTRLWEWVASNPSMATAYFSYQVGEGIANFIRDAGYLHGPVLDYGCGKGFLIEQFAKKGLETYGVDASDAGIAQTHERLKKYKAKGEACKIENFKTPYPGDFFELISCVETFEHIPQDDVGTLLKELHRLIKPGGVVLITTPCEENLENEATYCPFCDVTFHRWQHFRSYTPQSLSDVVSAYGFKVIFSRGMDFTVFQENQILPNWRYLNAKSLSLWIKHHYWMIRDLLSSPAPLKSKMLEGKLRLSSPKNICLLAMARK